LLNEMDGVVWNEQVITNKLLEYVNNHYW
jgi:hypothetical protein